MKVKTFSVLLIMLIVAIVAVGSVSAAEDATIDIADEPANDIVVEDVAADDVDESASDVEEDITADVNDENQGTRTTYDVDENTPNIQAVINNSEVTTHVVNFKPITYTNVALTIHGNVVLNGNGATLIGGGDNIFTIAGANNFTINGFNIVTNSTSKAAFYGANVFNANIENNNITGGKDGINIMQTYDNVTISDNAISGFTRDGISIIDHRTFDDLSGKSNSIISNNVITGISINDSEVGMFIGGNFKGTISGNVITNVTTGVDFTGKKAASNGRLYAEFHNNNISGISVGMYMNNHNIDFLNITNCNVGLNSPNITYAIDAPLNHRVTGYLGVFNSNFNGIIANRFINSVGNNYGNNTGFP